MYTQFLNSEEKHILNVALERNLEKKKRAFKRKRLRHFKNEKLKKIFEENPVEFSEKLYTIPFKCFFSFYLFLLLKKYVQFINWCETPYYYRIAESQDLNINKLSKETGVCRNSIRKAFYELVKMKLVEISNYFEPHHKACKPCLVYNDFYISCFDTELGHVLYSTEIPYNFYNRPESC